MLLMLQIIHAGLDIAACEELFDDHIVAADGNSLVEVVEIMVITISPAKIQDKTLATIAVRQKIITPKVNLFFIFSPL